MIKTVLIDLDNTLLETQALYSAAEARLQDYILARVAADPRAVAGEIQRRKLALFEEYGYDPAMLPRAYEETLVHFVPAANDNDILAARSFGLHIFEAEARLKDGAEEAIRRLSEHFTLCIVTVGDDMVQRRRIDALPFRDVFRELFIVPEKKPQTYASVLARLDCSPGEAVMIGDSLMSDIIPAVEAGLTAIHIPTENWTERETQGLELPKGRVALHASLSDAADFLVAARGDHFAVKPKARLRRAPSL